jgi:hypothetical protein
LEVLRPKVEWPDAPSEEICGVIRGRPHATSSGVCIGGGDTHRAFFVAVSAHAANDSERESERDSHSIYAPVHLGRESDEPPGSWR